MGEQIKIMFVDDEQIMRDGLRLTVDWESYGFQVLGSASNGEKALQLCEADPPDIMVTDIRMPVMDGLELTKHLVERYPAMKIIILSAYDDFKYAQTAISYGAHAYVLKAELELDHLLALALRLGKEILSKRQEQQRSQELLDRMKAHTKELRENLCWNLLVSQVYPQEVEKQLSDLSLDLYQEQLFVMHLCFREQVVPDFQEELDKPGLFRTAHWLESSKNRYILLANINPRFQDAVQLGAAVRELKQEIGLRVSCMFSVYYSPVFSGFEKICDYNERILNYIRLYSFYEQESVYYCTQAQLPAEPMKLSPILLELVQLTESNQLSQAAAWIEKTLISFQERLYHPDDIREAAYLICTVLEEKAKTLNEVCHPQLAKIRETFTGGMDTKEKIDQFKTLSGLTSQTVQYIRELSEFIHKNLYHYNSIVGKAIQYINLHLSQELSLNVIAKESYCNPTYLSQIFKEETGQNFSDYVTQTRVQRAALLLTTTRLSIGEIAEKVGIPNQSYFSRIFVKVTGVQPNKYRSSHKGPAKEA